MEFPGSSTLVPLAVALGIGLLVGLQREFTRHEMAGIRTFPVIAMLGVLTGVASLRLGGWLVAAGLLSVAALLAGANLARSKLEPEDHDVGLTTEIAALTMYGIGVGLALGLTTASVVAGGLLAVLLQFKAPLHRMVGDLDDADVRAIFEFVLVALVILPLLPNRSFGPYDVLNPFEVWLMVVLIAGISITAWAASRVLGTRRGLAITGIMGGLISSTATTVSYARQSARHGVGVAGTQAAAFVILMASAIVFVRVLLEIGLVAPGHWMALAPPLLGVMAILLVMALLQWRKIMTSKDSAGGGLPDKAPSELRAAIAFGFLYAVVLLAVAAAEDNLGRTGLYGVAALSGLTDVDAITLSTAHLVREGQITPGTGWRVVLVGVLSNLVFKGGAAWFLGSRTIRGPVFRGFGVTLFVGALILILL